MECDERGEKNLLHQNAVGSLEELAAGRVDEDPIFIGDWAARGQPTLSPGAPVPAVPDGRNYEYSETDPHTHTFLKLSNTYFPNCMHMGSMCMT